jgi:hypothetical protein
VNRRSVIVLIVSSIALVLLVLCLRPVSKPVLVFTGYWSSPLPGHQYAVFNITNRTKLTFCYNLGNAFEDQNGKHTNPVPGFNIPDAAQTYYVKPGEVSQLSLDFKTQSELKAVAIPYFLVRFEATPLSRVSDFLLDILVRFKVVKETQYQETMLWCSIPLTNPVVTPPAGSFMPQ